MSMTLLEMTQKILSSMDSDEVNSISDTSESLQVAHIIEDTFNYLRTSIDFPEHYRPFELLPSNNPNLPNMMRLPSNCDELLYLRYDHAETGVDTEPKYRYLTYVEKFEFIERMHQLNPEDPDVNLAYITITDNVFPTYYYNDRHPTEYTTITDRTLLFNAVDLTEDTTLQKEKTMAYGKLSRDFEFVDSFVPDLSEKHFALLFNESKSQAFIELKQQQNPLAERRARKGWVRTQVNKHSVKDPYENYRNLMSFARRR